MIEFLAFLRAITFIFVALGFLYTLRYVCIKQFEKDIDRHFRQIIDQELACLELATLD
jgi:hypothetical protein